MSSGMQSGQSRATFTRMWSAMGSLALKAWAKKVKDGRAAEVKRLRASSPDGFSFPLSAMSNATLSAIIRALWSLFNLDSGERRERSGR